MRGVQDIGSQPVGGLQLLLLQGTARGLRRRKRVGSGLGAGGAHAAEQGARQ